MYCPSSPAIESSIIILFYLTADIMINNKTI